ncbi:hypothetical protein [Tahibacter harae]|uniref:Uncharacterized protein n=1 Tax=Tahibacter harae TaxID=2963937 RepID=A0ABT1QQK2_9GAMM|nr:hypothetical protein [Tahibacter harae]MCQ4164545.1 hypothetical protein [Tahibacter harae]
MYTKFLSCKGLLAAALLFSAGAQAVMRPDPSFGSGGTAVADTAPTYYAVTPRLVELADRRLLVGSLLDTPVPTLVVARRLADGAADPAFGSAGVSSVVLGAGSWNFGQLVDLLPQADGGVLALVSWANNVPNGASTASTALIRLGPDGNPVPGFNGGAPLLLAGLQTIATRLLTYGGDVLVFAPVATESSPAVGFRAMRVRADGTPDPAFGSGGVLSVERAGAQASDWMILPGGGFQVLYSVLGSSGLSAVSNLWQRHRADGSLDTAFGSGGEQASPWPYSQLIDRLNALPGGLQLGVRGDCIKTVLNSYGQPVRELRFCAEGWNFRAQPLGDRLLVSGEQRTFTLPPPSDGTYLWLVDWSAAADVGFGNQPDRSWRPPDQPHDSFAVTADRDGRILLARRDAAGLRLFRYLDVRGVPSAAPVPALGPAGVGLVLLGLLLLARRRLMPV